MMKNRLIGGSAALKVSGNDDQNPGYSDTYKSKSIGMFHVPGLYPTLLKKNISVKGYILPAFDSNLSFADTYRPSSYESYRTPGIQNVTTGHDAFSGWFVPLFTVTKTGYISKGGVYNYYGKGKGTFISPSLLMETSPTWKVVENEQGDEVIAINMGDPIQDLRKYISLSKRVPSDYVNKFVTKPAFKAADTATWVLPTPSKAYIANAYCTGSNPYAKDYTEMKNRVLMFNIFQFDDLAEDLDRYRPGNLSPIDVDNPDFLYGDITNPTRALMFTSEAGSAQTAHSKLNFGKYNPRTGLVYKQEDLLTNVPGVLEGRYDLSDTENVIKIPTYDEVVNLLVSEALIPYEIVARVCASKCEKFPDNPDIVTEVNEPVESEGVLEEAVAQNTFTPKVKYPVKEEEDDIPGIKEAPIWTPPAQPVQQPAQAAAVTNDSNLTDEELAEFARLHKLMHTTGGLGMAVPDITRYGDLFTKGGVKAIALVEKMM